MELEVETKKYHRIYAYATWRQEGEKLIETVPLENVVEREFTLVPGDNIRLDGIVFHVVAHDVAIEQVKDKRFVHFIYRIQKGAYTPQPWIAIANVSL